jgi:hypothetical protein
MTQFGTHIETLLSSDRICNLIKYSNACAHLGGYIAEFGCWRGGSLEILTKFNPDVNILGVDSFEGLPAGNEHDYHQEGDFGGIDVRQIIGYFSMMYPLVRIFKSFIPKAFEFFDNNTRFSFSHVDLDLYQSIYDTLGFLLPRTLTNGMILLDDFKVKSTPGCEIAINNFFEAHPEIEVQHRGELKYFEGGKSHFQYLIVI